MKKVFLLLLVLVSFSVYAQPIQVTIQAFPPFTDNLSDYISTINSKFMVMANKNISGNTTTQSTYNIYLHFEVSGDNGVNVKCMQKPATPLTVNFGSSNVLNLSPQQLAQGVNIKTATVQGVNPTQFITNPTLPQGNYKICIEFIDFKTDQPLSNKGCTPNIPIVNITPPILVMPENDNVVEDKYPSFSWLPPSPLGHNGGMKYKLKIVEVIPNQSSNDAILFNPYFTLIPFDGQTQYIYKPTDPALQSGKKYAWQINVFQNDGKEISKSEIRTFKYLEKPILPPSITYSSSAAAGVTANNLYNNDCSSLEDSLKKKKEELEKKRKELADATSSASELSKQIVPCQDTMKGLKKAAADANEALKKANEKQKMVDNNISKGNTTADSDIAKKTKAEQEKAQQAKEAADAKVAAQEKKCEALSKALADAKRKAEITLPGEIKKLEEETRALAGAIEECKKTKALEEERKKVKADELAKTAATIAARKYADSITTAYNNCIIRNLYSYECICSKEYWDSKGLWDWLPDALNKPAGDAAEDLVSTPVPVDILNALLGMYQLVEKMKDPCSPLGMKRIGAAVTASGEINPKTGQPWDGTEKCEEMCRMIKRIEKLK